MPLPKKKLKKPIFASRPPSGVQKQQQKPKQQQQQQQQQQQNKQQHTPGGGGGGKPQSRQAGGQKQQQQRRLQAGDHNNQQHHQQWTCASVIDQQSSQALARLLAAADSRAPGATIKGLTLAPHIVHKKPTFAVTCETLKHLPLLKRLLADTQLLQQHEQQLSLPVAYVLAYELLFGEGLRRRGPAEVAVLQHKAQLQAALQQALQEAGVQDAAGWLLQAQQQQQQQQQHGQPEQQQQQPVVAHPRYARVNTLKASVQEVLARLREEAASAQDDDGAAADGSRKRRRKEHSSSGGSGHDGTAAAAPAAPSVDPLLPDVLVFPPGTDLHDHPMVRDGVLVLQSKASCMPAQALQPRAGWHIVDCCAAPGNKTTHAAALLAAADAAAAGGSNSSCGRVFAFDKDAKRLRRLQDNVDRLGAGGIVTAQAADFLSTDPLDARFAHVCGVILDPSCSGSGTAVSRMDHLLPPRSGGRGGLDHAQQHEQQEQEQQRLEQLARFQEAALRHALKFPALQRLVYSTCSIHRRENEDVVAAVLPDAEAAGFALARALPGWHRRGVPGAPGVDAALLARTDPQRDATDGFFVAVFERRADRGGGGAPPTHKKKHKKKRSSS